MSKFEWVKIEQIELLLCSLHFLPLMMFFENISSLYFVLSSLYFLALILLRCIRMIIIVGVVIEGDDGRSCGSELY